MSRRCRPSIIGGGGVGGDGGSHCGCGRTGHAHEPCLEPLIYGELLQDPGVEIITSLQEDRTDVAAWDGTHDQGPGWEWIAASQEGEGFIGKEALLPWFTDNANQIDYDITNQRTGTTCVKFFVIAGVGPRLQTGNIFSCELLPGYSHVQPQYRCQAGDLVTMSCWAKADGADLGVRLTVGTSRNGFGGPSSGPGSLFEVIPPGDGVYRQYTHSQFIADSSGQATYWLSPSWRAPENNGTGTVHMDDFSVILTVGEGSTLLCVFASLITIDNSTTETSFL